MEIIKINSIRVALLLLNIYICIYFMLAKKGLTLASMDQRMLSLSSCNSCNKLPYCDVIIPVRFVFTLFSGEFTPPMGRLIKFRLSPKTFQIVILLGGLLGWLVFVHGASLLTFALSSSLL